jgi:hypothetical protein
VQFVLPRGPVSHSVLPFCHIDLIESYTWMETIVIHNLHFPKIRLREAYLGTDFYDLV